MAETALELGIILQEENKNLQKETSELHYKCLILEAIQKENILKFRGFEEGEEGSEELAGSWAPGWLRSLKWKEENYASPRPTGWALKDFRGPFLMISIYL